VGAVFADRPHFPVVSPFTRWSRNFTE
jgi:hypothetical protein